MWHAKLVVGIRIASEVGVRIYNEVAIRHISGFVSRESITKNLVLQLLLLMITSDVICLVNVVVVANVVVVVGDLLYSSSIWRIWRSFHASE